ncbi:MAG: hypothetical protein U5N56_09860 [Candidatus Marinimicrobia bacterium]|nr:hypothetical protein [Candidatus Neomarinimicrobiota bacterium]
MPRLCGFYLPRFGVGPRGYWESHYNQWMWNTSSNLDYPEYYLPLTDAERYDKLSNTVTRHPGEDGYTEEGYPNTAASWMLLIGAGPFRFCSRRIGQLFVGTAARRVLACHFCRHHGSMGQ